jgi:EAL and modified HD-GYP domain-containing signal transduction protein
MKQSIVARQPILDRNKNTVAYELLYRSKNNKAIIDGSQATAEVIINSFNDIGINNLTSGKPAFINFTAELIKADIFEILPQNKIGIEILEDIRMDQHLIDCSRKIKESGHLILLDDFVYKKELIPLVEIADIIKIDFLETKGSQRKNIIDFIKKHHNSNVNFLAEKIENYKEFKSAYDCGYDYFQGYFFKKPNVFINRKIPSYKFTYLEVINELNSINPDLKKIAEIIKKDSAMTYSLLRTINAAIFGYEVSNLSQATSLLGTKRLKKWALLNLIKGLSSDKPDALFINTLTRGKMAELIGEKIGRNNIEIFYISGMLSLLDAYMDRDIINIMEEISLDKEIKEALVLRKGVIGSVLNIINYLENAEWDKLSKECETYNLDEADILKIFIRSVEYADKIMANMESNCI